MYAKLKSKIFKNIHTKINEYHKQNFWMDKFKINYKVFIK